MVFLYAVLTVKNEVNPVHPLGIGQVALETSETFVWELSAKTWSCHILLDLIASVSILHGKVE